VEENIIRVNPKIIKIERKRYTMKKFLILVFAWMMLLSACSLTGKEGTDIEAHDYWARTALKDGNGAAYLLLHNHTANEDMVTGVSSDAATATEIHLSQITADGVMEMVRQESVPLPADGELEFKPGGYHVMLIGIKQDLKAGDEITLTLHFKNHEDITLTVPVLEGANMGGSAMDGHTP
jgi:copper(I)-binding protein